MINNGNRCKNKTKRIVYEKTPKEEIRDQRLVNHVNELIKESNKKLYNLVVKKDELEKQIDESKSLEEQKRLKEQLEKLLKEIEELLQKIEYYRYEFDQKYLESIGIKLESKKSDRLDIGNERYLGIYRAIVNDIIKCETIINDVKQNNSKKIDEYEDRDKVFEEMKKIISETEKDTNFIH